MGSGYGEQQSSGLSQVRWCKMKGIPTNTFQYRCRKVRLAMEEKIQESKPDNAAIIPANRVCEIFSVNYLLWQFTEKISHTRTSSTLTQYRRQNRRLYYLLVIKLMIALIHFSYTMSTVT